MIFMLCDLQDLCDLSEWNLCDLHDLLLLTGIGFLQYSAGRCVPEGDFHACDLYIFTGWNLYDEVDISNLCTLVRTCRISV